MAQYCKWAFVYFTSDLRSLEIVKKHLIASVGLYNEYFISLQYCLGKIFLIVIDSSSFKGLKISLFIRMSSSYLLLVGDICDMDTVLQLHLFTQ